jgi:hypothetical protein
MSTSTIFKFPSVIRRQHEGPLGIHIDAYEAFLGEHGYSRRSTYVHLHIVADLSCWLKRRRLDVNDLSERTVERYLQSSRRFVDTYRGASSIPYKFLGMLRDQGTVNHKSMPVAVDPCEVAIANFKQYRFWPRFGAGELDTFASVDAWVTGSMGKNGCQIVLLWRFTRSIRIKMVGWWRRWLPIRLPVRNAACYLQPVTALTSVT